ncbi:hypothetical protein ID866_359 [Astraeus odoratus]|nr:hypothetical protein ID866_359 [Astraeus odoratus]
MQLATHFIDPLFHSFYYMQLNIYYLFHDKLISFAEGRYNVTSLSGSQIQSDYETNRTDAWSQIEDLNITKRIISTSKLVQSNRIAASPGSSVGRAPSIMSTSSTVSGMSRSMPPPSRSAAPPSFIKKAPPPPPGQQAAPPPYTPSVTTTATTPNNGTATAIKRPPPPPPPLKPKPKPEPEYVTALYDFDAQADGDLSFKTGDRIEVVVKTESRDDWWTGRLNGVQGAFPGNYVQ